MTQISTHLSIAEKHATIDLGTRKPTDYQQAAGFGVEPVYSPDAVIALTPFSEEVIQMLYITAKQLAGPKAKSANVSWSSTERGTDYRLDLVVRVDADWDKIEVWEYAIQDEITKRSGRWTDSEWDEYSQRIFHSLVPVHL